MKPKQLIFSTNNNHKLEEVRAILSTHYTVLSLQDIGETSDIPETGETLEENAMIKAAYLWEKYGYSCFADDTGLEVTALDNAPGVYSARYAGEGKDALANMEKLLAEMKGKQDRKAQFRTAVALILDGKRYVFEGIVKGRITEAPRGTTGFGYDPVFQPDGYNETFAELGLEIKNKISHRAKAIQQLALFLQNNG